MTWHALSRNRAHFSERTREYGTRKRNTETVTQHLTCVLFHATNLVFREKKDRVSVIYMKLGYLSSFALGYWLQTWHSFHGNSSSFVEGAIKQDEQYYHRVLSS